MGKIYGIPPVQPVHPVVKTNLNLKQESEKRRQQQPKQEEFGMVLKKKLNKRV